MKRNAATLNRDMLVCESSREHFALYSSVWLERLRQQEVAGSNPARGTMRCDNAYLFFHNEIVRLRWEYTIWYAPTLFLLTTVKVLYYPASFSFFSLVIQNKCLILHRQTFKYWSYEYRV